MERRLVSGELLREKYNELNYLQQARDGMITQRVARNSHRNDPLPNLPYCTRSQIIRYYDHEGNRVAVVHQYVLPDGSLGGSGQPDPKLLAVGGEIWYTE